MIRVVHYLNQFSGQIGGEDRVLLHLQLVDGGGKRSIVSSRKKVPEAEWATLTETLTGMQLTWRDREPRRKAKAATIRTALQQ